MLNKPTFDLADFLGRGLLRSPWFWGICFAVVSVVNVAIVVAVRRNLLVADEMFRCLQLFGGVAVVLSESYAALDSYLTIRALAIDWRSTEESDPSVYIAVECAARSIKRSPIVCALAAVWVIVALR